MLKSGKIFLYSVVLSGFFYLTYQYFKSPTEPTSVQSEVDDASRLYKEFPIDELKSILSKTYNSANSWPTEVVVRGKNYIVEYSFDEELQGFAKSLMRRYESDHTSIVVVDNNTGELLTAIDYDKSSNEFGRELTFSSSSPAASIIKVVTAANLVEQSKVNSNTEFNYRGRATTLFKSQVRNLNDPYGKKVDFGKAFASSNNVVFAKAALKNLNAVSMLSMAERFGFNKGLFDEFSAGVSNFNYAVDDFNLAELASGFNTSTMMSPVHGSLIASVIANDGVMVSPKIVKSVREKGTNKIVWMPIKNHSRVFSKATANEMANLMRKTVLEGTARKSFRATRKNLMSKIEIGGKTGSITGGIPYGKRDWFVSYAKPWGGSDAGISICVMIINVRKWHVRSSFLAKELIAFYYQTSKNEKISMR